MSHSRRRPSQNATVIGALIALALILAPNLVWAQDAPPATPRNERPVRISRGLLHEGAFLADQPGRLVALEQGGSAFVFDRNTEGRATPPMAMLPCTTLMRMEQIREAREGEARFRVSGQVFVYEGRNHLLPTFYKVLADAEEVDAEAAPAEEAEAADDTEQDADPSVEELIAELDELTPIARSEELDTMLLPSADLLSDSSFLKPRLGSIVRSVSGSLAFVIDNDVDEAAGAEAPMPIMPCQSLALIEELIDVYGADAPFILSGRVFLYRGQNFLLPSMVQMQLDRTSGLSSAR